jgi:hypothetical protein
MSLAERIGVADVLWCRLLSMLVQVQAARQFRHPLAVDMCVENATLNARCTITTLVNTRVNVVRVAVRLRMLRLGQLLTPRLPLHRHLGLEQLASIHYGRICLHRFSKCQRLSR